MLTGKFALVTGSLGGIASQPPKHWRGWRLRQEMQCDGTGFEEPEETFLSTRQPSRKFVKDENVAGLITLLCGPHGDDISGSVLPIDGAWTAGC
ncbi:MAG: 3-hydroxybutyrate dehydrogenase [Acetobacteraceae bacterium]|nr:3-hydroxybutyrate dehydrogenase [Acetobacteraceae bacterium]